MSSDIHEAGPGGRNPGPVPAAPVSGGKSGAILVVGAGIAGIQASLDLAEMGFFVYLVEKNPAIGGRMAQLDKVFPTNDCAMCIISPKLNDIGGHINIEVINGAELAELSGEPGNFTAKVLRRPRHVDLDKCTACGDCSKACPVDVPSEFNQGLGTRKAVYKPYAQAYPNAFALSKEAVSPCVAACPAHVNAHGYVALAGQGRFQEALEVVMDVLPLPGTLGRICAHPCESACRRGLLEGPLDIRNIKRLVADRGDLAKAGETFAKAPEVTGACAIVGAGPAGLSCAWHLARRGVRSVVFEASGAPGGALRMGIPDYRLPPEVLDRECGFILEWSGAEARYGQALGRDFTLDGLFGQGFKAVFLAMGAHNNVPLRVPGEDLPGVVPGVRFLRDVNSGSPPDLKGRKVLVIGGGNVAMDAARSAVRLGASVALAYRRGLGAMPAWSWEREEAAEEGVEFMPMRAPKGFEALPAKGGGPGRLKARLVLTEALGDPDDRKAGLIEIPQDVKEHVCDLVISAAGQLPSSEGAAGEPGLKIGRGGRIEADPVTFETGRAGVFAGGDVQLGPALAIDAVAAGKEAAVSIARFMAGEDMRAGRDAARFTLDGPYRDLPEDRRWRNSPAKLPPAERVRSFREMELGFTEAQGLDEAGRCCACGACARCMRCVKACLPGALTPETHAQEPETLELEVGAVVLAAGFEPYDPSDAETWRYRDSPNIVTSLEFERILSASGPSQGHMTRPSDGREPKRIAWLQCVGSRDINRCDRKYCSSVCCMYAMKEAAIAKEHAGSAGGLEASVFYMDIRSHGKDFEKYYERAKEAGVRFVRSRIHTLTPLPDGDVALEYIEEGGALAREVFDMAVLSVGLSPAPSLKALAGTLGVGLTPDGFVLAPAFEPVFTGRPGVYACGAVTEPKDIPHAVMEAQAAAQAAGASVAGARFTRTRSRSYPEERDITGEAPRIGVFVCSCGINIASVVDVEAVAGYARSLPFVELAENNLFTCSADTQAKIRSAIAELKLNRVVVASCSPRTHEAMFRETLAQAGINRYLFEMANIRDQDSWVHQSEPERATAKAKDLVRAAVAKAAFLEPMYQTRMDLTREALVVGGGVAGLTAALAIADLGFKAHLVERSGRLGGEAPKVRSRGKDLAAYAESLAKKAMEHPLVEVRLNSRPIASEGFVGNFVTRIATAPPDGGASEAEFELRHGATVLACGGKAHEPGMYLYGKSPRVILSLDMDAMLKRGDPWLSRPGASFGFIQCVESRVPERPYCSRVCCTHTLESALSILDLNPTARVFVAIRDMRSYGFRERLYEEARERGVIFVRYGLDSLPEVSWAPGGGLYVTVTDHVLGRPLRFSADWLTLASGIDPVPMKEEIVEVFKGQLNAEGFLLEAHMKLRPVDLATDGQYMAGLAHYPKPAEESIAQARAAAARAAGVLAKPYIMVGGVVAEADPAKCAACCTCVRACPVKVPKIVPDEGDPSRRGHAFMEPAICQGCGVCVSECPGKAIKLQFFTDEQLISKVSALAEGPGKGPGGSMPAASA
ncbi:MAG: FAD-dependent oxidoreductase [Deltaproteobacteria bacterium]|jgi:heterodisulfide reductase subunit A-like polyferredoxin|nr:FAD-dependent oxidoreductase [Deltaproteobacteria bacterium]